MPPQSHADTTNYGSRLLPGAGASGIGRMDALVQEQRHVGFILLIILILIFLLFLLWSVRTKGDSPERRIPSASLKAHNDILYF